MPIISLTQEQIDRAKKVDPGYHKVTVVSYEEKANSKKDGTNHFFALKVISGESNRDRYINYMASSKALGLSLLPFVAAIEQISVDEVVPGDIDTDKLLGRELVIEVEDEIYKEELQPKVKNCLPADAVVDFVA